MDDLIRHYRYQRQRNPLVSAAKALELARWRIASRNALSARHPDVAASYDDPDPVPVPMNN